MDSTGPADTETSTDDRLGVLQALRLKRRATAGDIAAVTGGSEESVTAIATAEQGTGLVKATGDRFALTPQGREALVVLLAEERKHLDVAAVESAYGQFTTFNDELKALASEWQNHDGQPNDHSDDAYDAAVLNRLYELDGRFQPLAVRIGEIAPRLRCYSARFEAAIARVRAGDVRWFLGPIIDSYHTVWFELHEELIGFTGRTREAEARSGRAD